MDLRLLALVALGGALGSAARWGLAGFVTRGEFPWGTVAVNLVGSFALGFLVFSDLARGAMDAEARAFLAVGVLGGFTTMSTFAVEFLGLAEQGDAVGAGLYWMLNAFATLVAALGGRALAYAAG